MAEELDVFATSVNQGTPAGKQAAGKVQKRHYVKKTRQSAAQASCGFFLNFILFLNFT